MEKAKTTAEDRAYIPLEGYMKKITLVLTNQMAEGGTLRIVTFATHSEGTFDDLKKDMTNNKLDLHVIGWGEKWINYMHKLKSVRECISKFHPKDVVIILDAFDTRMRAGRTTEDILAIYNVDFDGHGVVFSKQNNVILVPDFMSKYIIHRVFGGMANAGMYVGRIEDMLPVLDDAIKLSNSCKGDDQCGFNKLLHDHDIRIDEHYKLFKNLEYSERAQNINEHTADAVFYGYPGSLTFSRLSRVPREYFPFLWREIVLMIIVIVAIFVMVSRLFASRKKTSK